jgi:hypothetical protein
MLTCRYEMSLSRFAAYSPFEISCFLAVTSMRYPCEILRFICCIIFVRDILMRFLAFLGRYELCV